MQTFLDWIVTDFYIFGASFQYWMPLFVAIFGVIIFLNRRGNQISRR